MMNIAEHSQRVRSPSKNRASVVCPVKPVPTPEWWLMIDWVLGLNEMQLY